jgi:hypothetical protein
LRTLYLLPLFEEQLSRVLQTWVNFAAESALRLVPVGSAIVRRGRPKTTNRTGCRLDRALASPMRMAVPKERPQPNVMVVVQTRYSRLGRSWKRGREAGAAEGGEEKEAAADRDRLSGAGSTVRSVIRNLEPLRCTGRFLRKWRTSRRNESLTSFKTNVDKTSQSVNERPTTRNPRCRRMRAGSTRRTFVARLTILSMNKQGHILIKCR